MGRKPAPAWPGWRSIAVALGALVVAVAVWRVTTVEPTEAARPIAAAAVVEPPAPRPAPAAVRPAGLPAPSAIPLAPYPEAGLTGVSTDDPLTAYRKANIYPPTSRPLSAEQLDLLRPNTRHETMRPVDRGGGVTYLFTADRYFVIGDETLTATLEVRRDGAPIDVAIARAFAVVLDPVRHEERPIPLAYARRGGQLASTFAPAKLGLARQSAIGMYIEFDHGGGTQRAHFDFQYTPDRGIPARFTGAFRESLDAGSLVIHAGVAVTAPGHYVIDANLFDAADQPIAWTRFKGDLAAGAREADLLFFGKVIVDAGARGPFHIGQLRGARFAPGQDPDLEQILPFAGSYTTRAYPTDAFSDAEYDSPDKQRMIDLLGADKNHRGAAAGR